MYCFARLMLLILASLLLLAACQRKGQRIAPAGASTARLTA